MTQLEPGNRQNTQPRPGEAEAVEAAAKAFWPGVSEWKALDRFGPEATTAVAAAYPVIALAVLEAVEQRMENVRPPAVSPSEYWAGYNSGAAGFYLTARHLVAALRSELSGESSLGAGQ